MPESQNEQLENAENTGGPEGAGDQRSACGQEFSFPAFLQWDSTPLPQRKAWVREFVAPICADPKTLRQALLVGSKDIPQWWAEYSEERREAWVRDTLESIPLRQWGDLEEWVRRSLPNALRARESDSLIPSQRQQDDHESEQRRFRASLKLNAKLNEKTRDLDRSNAELAALKLLVDRAGLDAGVPEKDVATTPGASKNGRASKAFVEALKKLLGEIESKLKESDKTIDFKAMPGKCANLHELACKQKYFQRLTLSTFQKYQKTSGLCSFGIHSADSDFYRDTFPDLFK